MTTRFAKIANRSAGLLTLGLFWFGCADTQSGGDVSSANVMSSGLSGASSASAGSVGMEGGNSGRGSAGSNGAGTGGRVAGAGGASTGAGGASTGAGVSGSSTGVSGSSTGAGGSGASAGSGNVRFSDDFSGTALGADWLALNRHGDYGNSQSQCYLPANAAVTGGNLVITSQVQTQTCGDSRHSASTQPYTSAMVQWKSFNFTYGTLEFRAKMAGGKGPWPAIWLLGSNCQTTNVSSADNFGTCNWPTSGSDEIDITEILGSDLTHVNQQIHSNGNNGGCTATTSDVSQNWHVYQLVWAASSLTWTIDGVQTCHLTSGIPSTPMFLMVNTALGDVGGTVVNSTLPQQLTVDYIRLTTP